MKKFLKFSYLFISLLYIHYRISKFQILLCCPFKQKIKTNSIFQVHFGRYRIYSLSQQNVMSNHILFFEFFASQRRVEFYVGSRIENIYFFFIIECEVNIWYVKISDCINEKHRIGHMITLRISLFLQLSSQFYH